MNLIGHIFLETAARAVVQADGASRNMKLGEDAKIG